jgi:hypothetical protein
VSSSPISPGTVPGPGLQDIASRIASAQSVSASLDSIIFSDGSTWGPNLGRLNEDIVARKIAADYVLKLVTAALEGNQDWKPALKELLANRYDPETNFTQKWKSRFAQQLLLEQVPISAGIAFLKAIPAPMKFTNGQMLGGPATGVSSTCYSIFDEFLKGDKTGAASDDQYDSSEDRASDLTCVRLLSDLDWPGERSERDACRHVVFKSKCAERHGGK